MTRRSAAAWRRLTAGVAAACLASGGPTAAQTPGTGRLAIEAVAAANNSSTAPDDPFVFLDLATTIRLTDGMDIIIRPYARRLPGGDWDALLYQAQIRYQPVASVRLDAGIITSPLGLGTLELRQDLNPVVGSPFYYFAPLPLFDSYSDRVQILSGGYPIGAILSVSGERWDARGGVIDGTPARYRKVFAADAPSAAAQFVAGAGVSPFPGLRLGAGIARGRYRSSKDLDYYGAYPAEAPENAGALVLNLEGEYAVRYTRITGEWVRDRFESEAGPAVARGLYLQAVQTISPRIFVASRLTRATAPVQIATGRTRWTRTAAEMTAGYRLTPELTVKGGYEVSRRFGVTNWSHAAVGSIVWSKRWF